MTLDPDSARRKMIQQQIRCWNVSNPRVLNALQTVPREHFVAAEFAALAFADTRLPIDASTSKTMLTPQLEGRILQALDPGPDDKVLEVGTGSGYLTACLAQLARHVTSIDVSPARIEAAEARLADLGITNCELQVQDVYERREATSYDVIAVTGSIAAYDPRFEQWLNPGGRAFIVVGTAPAMEACLIVQAVDGGTRVESLFETVVPPLTIAGNAAEPAFRF